MIRKFILAFVMLFSLSALQAREISSSEVKPYNGHPALYLNGTPTLPQFYALTDRPTGRCSYESCPSHNIGLFAESGIRLYQLDIWFEYMLKEDGQLDISEALRLIDGVLAKCPEGAVMFRMHTNPPRWWLEKHPEEWVRYADTEVIDEPYRPSHQNFLWQELNPIPRCSFASVKCREWMKGNVAEFCRRLSATPQGRHVMGIQIADGLNGEYHNWAFVKHDPDVSEPMRLFYHEFLKEKYGSDAALRKAWNNPEASIESAAIPGKERHVTGAGIFRDPEREMPVSDYYEALHKTITVSILSFADVVKKSWGRPVAVGCFYGYYFSMFGRQAAGGHLLEQDILEAPQIDFLCAPQAYNKNSRLPGGPGLSRGLVESVNLHGKLWLDEMDQPSHFGVTYLGGLQVHPKEQSRQILRKFVLEPFLRGGGMWYYDFGPIMTSGWWDDPYYQEEISSIHSLEEKYFHRDNPSPADVLLVFDTKVFLHTASREIDDPITDQLSVNVVPIEIFKSGASIATCYLSDIGRMPLDKYKTVVFMNCFLMDKQQRDWIKKNVASGGRSLVWLTAPGYNDGKCLDYRHTCDLTGIKLDTFESSSIPDIAFSERLGGTVQSGDAIADIGNSIFMSKKDRTAMPSQTFFSVVDEKADVLAVYGGRNKQTAACCRHFKNYDSYFFGLPPISPSVWRKVFSDAGCHIYDYAGDSVIAGSGLLMVHTKDGGERILHLKNGKAVQVELSPVQTLVLDAESGEVLL